MRYLSVIEIAKKWNISERSVRNYCAHGRVQGAFLTGKTWNIPENAEKPERSNKKKGHTLTLLDILREQKKKYPQIELVLVLAYLNTGRDVSGYDSTVYPPLENVPRRFSISHRNRWMVESADVVVAYVLHDWGGAATTLRCAKQKKKQIISYRDEMGS